MERVEWGVGWWLRGWGESTRGAGFTDFNQPETLVIVLKSWAILDSTNKCIAERYSALNPGGSWVIGTWTCVCLKINFKSS